MSTYEHDLLAARFAAVAPEPLPGDWGDVLGRAGTARKGRRWPGRSPAQQGRRRRLLVALAAAVLVAAVAAAAFATVRYLFFDKGFIGVPPPGATPSTPERGKLVLFYWGPVPGDWGKSRFWAYADGRLISLREADRPEGANRRSTGYLEQRLTPAGVERLRSEIVSMGLIGDEDDGAGLGERIDAEDDFAIGSVPVARETTTPVPWYSMLQVRHGDRLYRISRVSDLGRLVARITDPTSWLPASAWDDPEIRAYVPSRYAVCFDAGPQTAMREPSRILALLPKPAAALLRAQGFLSYPPSPWVCPEMATEDARALAKELDDAGVERSGAVEPYALGYRLGVAGRPDEVLIQFEPYLPHGEFTCSPCG